MFVPLVRQTLLNMSDPEVELRDVRRAIDGVDAAIGTLLASRLKLSRMAILNKVRMGLPVIDPLREGEIQRSYEQSARGSSPVARAVLRWCRGNCDER